MTYIISPEPPSGDQGAEPHHRVQKVSDEGSSSLFVARIFVCMLEYRDLFLGSHLQGQNLFEVRNKFDKKFRPMCEAAQAARDGGQEIIGLVKKHRINVASGRIVRIHANQYDILETIDISLGQAVNKVITQGTIAIKTGLQTLLSDIFGVDIGFVFQKRVRFNGGIAILRATGESDFAEYLIQVREVWLSDFIDLRNLQEHHGWTLEGVKYTLVGGTSVAVNFPTLANLPVDQFAQSTINRITLLIENTMVYAFQKISKGKPINIVEIPNESRDPNNPQRFRLAPRGLDLSLPWKITYKDEIGFI